MSYTVNLEDSARRHLRAGHRLLAETKPQSSKEEAVAGYLFGLAAELAIKHMAQKIDTLRMDAVFYAHFPDLRVLVREHAQGRRAQPLLRLVTQDFMGGWDVKMRYAPTAEVLKRDLSAWQAQATRAVSTMEAL